MSRPARRPPDRASAAARVDSGRVAVPFGTHLTRRARVERRLHVVDLALWTGDRHSGALGPRDADEQHPAVASDTSIAPRAVAARSAQD